MRRCCERHPDWPTLAQHLVEEFPDAEISAIVRELRAAREAVAGKGLDEAEEMDVAELIARHQLLMLTGETVDVARLDPEQHQHRN